MKLKNSFNICDQFLKTDQNEEKKSINNKYTDESDIFLQIKNL